MHAEQDDAQSQGLSMSFMCRCPLRLLCHSWKALCELLQRSDGTLPS